MMDPGLCIFSWRLHLSKNMNALKQNLHLNGFIPKWMRSCRLHCQPVENSFWQYMQAFLTNGLILPVPWPVDAYAARASGTSSTHKEKDSHVNLLHAKVPNILNLLSILCNLSSQKICMEREKLGIREAPCQEILVSGGKFLQSEGNLGFWNMKPSGRFHLLPANTQIPSFQPQQMERDAIIFELAWCWQTDILCKKQSSGSASPTPCVCNWAEKS